MSFWLKGLIIFLGLCPCVLGVCSPRSVDFSTWRHLKQQLMESYDDEQPPALVNEVAVHVDIWKIDKIDTVLGSYQLDVQVSYSYTDCRLAFNASDELFVVLWEDGEIWDPDLFLLGITDYSTGRTRVSVGSTPDGTVHVKKWFIGYHHRCPMQLRALPFDTQTCNLTAQTRWGNRIVSLVPWEDHSKNVGYFGLTKADIHNHEWEFGNWISEKTQIQDVYDILTYDAVLVSFTIHRKHYWYTVNLIIPAFLLWWISYLSMWLSPEATPARAAILLMPILILINLSSRAFNKLPIISSPTWLTDFVLALTVLCCAHLTEFVLVHILLQIRAYRLKERKAKALRERRISSPLTPLSMQPSVDASQISQIMIPEPIPTEYTPTYFERFVELGCDLDHPARVVFILSFLTMQIYFFAFA